MTYIPSKTISPPSPNKFITTSQVTSRQATGVVTSNIAHVQQSAINKPDLQSPSPNAKGSAEKVALKIVSIDTKRDEIKNALLNELSEKFAKINKKTPDENHTNKNNNRFSQHIADLKAQDALEAPKRAKAEAKEDTRVANAQKVELEAKVKIVAEARSAQDAASKTKAPQGKDGAPPPPPPLPIQLVKAETKTTINPKNSNQSKLIKQPDVDNTKEMLQKELLTRLSALKGKLKTVNSKAKQDINLQKEKYTLDAPKRAEAEKKEIARVTQARQLEINAELVKEAKAGQEMNNKAKMKFNANGVPLPPPLPPMRKN